MIGTKYMFAMVGTVLVGAGGQSGFVGGCGSATPAVSQQQELGTSVQAITDERALEILGWMNEEGITTHTHEMKFGSAKLTFSPAIYKTKEQQVRDDFRQPHIHLMKLKGYDGYMRTDLGAFDGIADPALHTHGMVFNSSVAILPPHDCGHHNVVDEEEVIDPLPLKKKPFWTTQVKPLPKKKKPVSDVTPTKPRPTKKKPYRG